MERRIPITTDQPAVETTIEVVQRPVPRLESGLEPVRKTPILFIHGLWLHATSWQSWVSRFNAAGYDARAPGWPYFPDTVAGAREHPDFMFDMTIGEVVSHYAFIIAKLPAKPVVIGHSFGGLVAQELLDQDMVAAAVAIDPAPIKGVLPLPLAQLRAALPVLGHPLTVHKTVSLKPDQFRYGFANQLSDTEAAELYYDWTIPAPSKPLWQAALANFQPHAESAVNVHKNRAPLLLMAGKEDHTVPAKVTRLVQRLYKASPAVTDLKEWPGRGHSLVIDKGWRELADYTLTWLTAQGIR